MSSASTAPPLPARELPPGCTIRPARRRDLAGLAALEAAAFTYPWPETALAEELVGPAACAWVATATTGAPQDAAPTRDAGGRSPLAYALFRRVADEAELLRVAVDPAARRRGLAAALVVRGLAELAATGARRCFLEVRADNDAAIALYAALGFTAVGRRPRYYPDGETAVLYARTLSGSVAHPGGGCYPDLGSSRGGADDAGS